MDLVETEALLFQLRISNISNLPDTSASEIRHHSVDTPFYHILIRRPFSSVQNGVYNKMMILI